MDIRQYRVDAAGLIAQVDTGWDEFARANDGAGALASHVVGRPLLDFVNGASLKHLYFALMNKVRTGGTAVLVPFRCDAPQERRTMEMRIERLENGDVLFQALTLDRMPRSPEVLIAADARRTADLLRMCSWCKRVAAPNGWLEVEDASRSMRLLEMPALPDITHVLCPACERQLAAQLT